MFSGPLGLAGLYSQQAAGMMQNACDAQLQQVQMQNMYVKAAAEEKYRWRGVASYKGYAIQPDYGSDTFKIRVGGQIITCQTTATTQEIDRIIESALNDQNLKVEINGKFVNPEVKKVTSETIPDVSLTRVLKWAIVLVVAMGLGKKVWAMFGDKITAQVHKAIGAEET